MLSIEKENKVMENMTRDAIRVNNDISSLIFHGRPFMSPTHVDG